MASMTSVISFFILLLATYSYSAPITPEYESSTMVEQEQPGETHLWSGNEVNHANNLHNERGFKQYNDEESSTFGDVTFSPRGYKDSSEESSTFAGVTLSPRGYPESSEESTTFGDVTRSSRTLEQISFPSSTVEGDLQNERGLNDFESSTEPISEEKRGVYEFESSTEPLSEEKRGVYEFEASTEPISEEKRGVYEFEASTEPISEEKRNFFDYSTLAMETATTFNQRAFGHDELPESFETSTSFSVEEQPEIERNVTPSSSVDSFGKSTGLLHNQQQQQQQIEQQSVYPVQKGQFQQIQGQSQFPPQKAELEQTVNLPSGQILETKVYASKPSKLESSQSNSASGVKYFAAQPTRPSPLF